MKTLFTLLIAIAFAGNIFSQNVITVDNNVNSGADFSSIQAAIDAASDDDIILVHPSPDNYGNCTISKTIHIRGIAHAPELNSGEHASCNTINFNALGGADNSTISGLDIYNINVIGAGSYNNIQIINNMFRYGLSNGGQANTDNWLIQGNYCQFNIFSALTKSNANNWMVVNNYILQQATAPSWSTFDHFNSSDVLRNNVIATAQTGSDILLFNQATNAQIENCILVNQGGTSFNFSNQTWTNCLSYSYSGVEFNTMPGSDNLDNVNPGFDSDNDNIWYNLNEDYHITTDSPAYEYGTDGESLGIYGNGFEFDPRGYPRDLPYPVNMTISSTVVNVGEDIEVQIEARGN